LEDEEYVDDDEDIFAELVAGGKVDEHEAATHEDEWADFDANDYDELKPEEVEPREGEEEWETAFRKFKLEQKNNYDSDGDSLATDEAEERDTLAPLPTAGAAAANAAAKAATKKKKKKKIGAKTDLTGFSMSSSALFRNEGLTLLDDRFDRIEAQYNEDDEEEEDSREPFDMSKERNDLEAIMDDFLDNYVVEGKKMHKK
jgi:protein LTV1